LFLNHEHKKQQ